MEMLIRLRALITFHANVYSIALFTLNVYGILFANDTWVKLGEFARDEYELQITQCRFCYFCDGPHEKSMTTVISLDLGVGGKP